MKTMIVKKNDRNCVECGAESYVVVGGIGLCANHSREFEGRWNKVLHNVGRDDPQLMLGIDAIPTEEEKPEQAKVQKSIQKFEYPVLYIKKNYKENSIGKGMKATKKWWKTVSARKRHYEVAELLKKIQRNFGLTWKQIANHRCPVSAGTLGTISRGEAVAEGTLRSVELWLKANGQLKEETNAT